MQKIKYKCKKKKICKNCRLLNFYDWYFCSKTGETICDIDSVYCKYYKRRYSDFWMNKDGEF